jgi:poly(A) polymerase
MNACLPDAPWRRREGMAALIEALGHDTTRFVGGAVRDTLLGLEVKDVDIATVHAPEEVMQRLGRAGIKVVPTGIAHGTVTAVLPSGPVEITTLRQDVSTDGRHATVRFTHDWRADAMRRDFTINALYAEPQTGAINDFFEGTDDLRAGRVRFIGSARDRIAEDHLRILRFFRFFARFGQGEPDADGYAACVAAANSLMALSRERIADELLKLLALPDPADALARMVGGGIMAPVLPEIGSDGVARLGRLIAREAAAGLPPAPLRRLAALLPPTATVGEEVAARLKLSVKARKRIMLALDTEPREADPKVLAYRIGAEGAIDRLLLGNGDPAAVPEVKAWIAPRLPIGGGALVAMGLSAGPDVARVLRQIEEQWIAEGFPDTERVHMIAAERVSAALAAKG